MRGAIGLNWAQQFGRVAASTGRRGEDSDFAWLILFFPQQAELSWERSCGSERMGLTLSYAI